MKRSRLLNFCLTSLLLLGQHTAALSQDSSRKCFEGTMEEQAECLLGARSYYLPALLTDLMSAAPTYQISPLDINERLLLTYLGQQKVSLRNLGYLYHGQIYQARYFLIHGLKPFVLYGENYSDGDYDFQYLSDTPPDLNTWAQHKRMHVYINPAGDSMAAFDLGRQLRPVGDIPREQLIHVGLTQNAMKLSADGPWVNRPSWYFSDNQLNKLALIYLIASVRRGQWLIPAIHYPILNHSRTRNEKFYLSDQPTYTDLQVADWMEHLQRHLEGMMRLKYGSYSGVVIEGKRKSVFLDGLASNAIAANLGDRLNLRLYTLKQDDGTEKHVYRLLEVQSKILDRKHRLLEALNSKEYSGMRKYVQWFFPSVDPVPPSILNAGSGEIKAASFVRTNGTNSLQTNYVEPSIADKLYNLVNRFIAGKVRKNKRTVNLSVESKPKEASVELSTDLGSIRTTSTNAILTNVVRGIYTYDVQKYGYKRIRKTVNLVDEKGTLFSCKLYSIYEQDGPYPCSFIN